MIPDNETNCKRKCSNKYLNKNLPTDTYLEHNADLLKTLADPTRLKIIFLLKNKELCACEILDAIDKSQSTVSHHLNMMKKGGILSTRKQGTWIYYKLTNENLLEILENLFYKIK